MRTSITTVLIGMAVSGLCANAEKTRQKRYLFINAQAPITLGFILNMPISLGLPKFASPVGRSFDSQSEFLFGEEDEIPTENFYWDPAYEQELSRVSSYFDLMEINSLACREKLICQLASETETFSPVSDIFMKELRLLHGPVKTTRDSLMWRYLAAARDGLAGSIEECSVTYPKCSLSAERILNMPLLRLWQFVAEKINLQLI